VGREARITWEMSYPQGRVSGVKTLSAPDVTRPAPAPLDRALRRWLPGYLALAAIWGSSFLFIKVGISQLPPIYVTWGRAVAGAAVLLVILVALRHKLPRDLRVWAHLTVVAAVGVVVPFTLFGYGEQRISSVLAGIWNATTPLVALPVAVLIFRTEAMTVRRAAGLVVGFVGVLVILGVWSGAGGSGLTGQLMCGVAALCYGIAIPYQRRFLAGRPESGVSLAAGQLLVAIVELTIVAPLISGPPPRLAELSLNVVVSVLALGVLGTGIAFALNFRVIRLAGATTSASVTYLVPIWATVVGVVVLHERLTWYQPVGAMVVLTGVALSQGLFARRRSLRRAGLAQPAHGPA
jgi:drug/metabolite transporter (DMT)-like permease